MARELRPGGNPAAVDLLGGAGTDERFARHTLTFLTDHLGSTVALANPDGTIYKRYGYDPYGATSVTGTVSSNPFQFAGREQVGTTGLYHNRARHYRADWGRFISEDPIGIRGGINLYAYANNNPLQLRDPWGLCASADEVIAICSPSGGTGNTRSPSSGNEKAEDGREGTDGDSASNDDDDAGVWHANEYTNFTRPYVAPTWWRRRY